MIYCQLLPRLTLETGTALQLSDIAGVIGPEEASRLPVACPDAPGIWQLDALVVTELLQTRYPREDIVMLGADSCFIHRVKPRRLDHTRWLRTIGAMLILLLGSALGLAWFHSDVDMPGAMEEVYRLFTGQPVTDARLITIPYVIGVALGTAVFYALGSRNAVTPLDVKLSDYRQDLERAEAKHVE